MAEVRQAGRGVYGRAAAMVLLAALAGGGGYAWWAGTREADRPGGPDREVGTRPAATGPAIGAAGSGRITIRLAGGQQRHWASVPATQPGAGAAAGVPATLVTLHVSDAAAESVLARLGQQAGVSISAAPAVAQQIQKVTMTVDVEGQPLWLVLKEVCAGLNLRPVNTREGDISLAPARVANGELNGMNKPATAVGPFLFVAEGAAWTRTAEVLPPNTVSPDCAMELAIYVEPKLRVTQWPFAVQLDEAVDERGNSLIPAGRAEAAGEARGAYRLWRVRVPLQLPADGAKRIVRLRGTARFGVEMGPGAAVAPVVVPFELVDLPLP